MTPRDSVLSALPPDAHALRLVRGLPDNRLRIYSATTFPSDPWQGCERTIRMGRAVGWIADAGSPDDYAVLDVLNEDWDIVADFSVPTAQGFRGLKKRLGAVVEDEG